MNRPRHAYFSSKSSCYNYTVYRTDEGKEIYVTALFSTKEIGDQTYGWDDKEYLGEFDNLTYVTHYKKCLN